MIGDPYLMLYVAKDSLSRRLRYGDCLEAELTLAAPNGTLNPCQFDYRKFLYRKGIVATAYLKTDTYEVYDNQSHGLIGWCKQSQSTLVDRLRQSELNDSYKGFAEAMLLGWKHDVDEGMEAQFRDAGIMHLLCVSGLHVGLVSAMIGACLFFCSAHSMVESFACVAAIGWHMGFCLCFRLVACGGARWRDVQHLCDWKQHRPSGQQLERIGFCGIDFGVRGTLVLV